MSQVVAALVDGLRAAVGVPAAAYALAAIGLNLHFGYTGLLNFGHVGFLMIGAYGLAVTVHHGGPLWLGLLVGVLAALALGLVFGLPTLRLRADYLAIVTIATAEILRLVLRSRAVEPLTRGVFGITRFAGGFYDLNPVPPGSYGFGRLVFSDRTLWVMLVAWALVALGAFALRRLVRSPWGRVLRAIREEEDAVRSLGKNVFGYKLQSLLIGGAVGGLAGMVLAVDSQAVNPDTFSPTVTFFVYTVLILGGPGTILGPVVGSMLFWFVLQSVDSLLRAAISNDLVVVGFLEASDLGAVRFALVGAALVLLMVFRPQGLLGNKEELRLDVG